MDTGPKGKNRTQRDWKGKRKPREEEWGEENSRQKCEDGSRCHQRLVDHLYTRLRLPSHQEQQFPRSLREEVVKLSLPRRGQSLRTLLSPQASQPHVVPTGKICTAQSRLKPVELPCAKSSVIILNSGPHRPPRQV